MTSQSSVEKKKTSAKTWILAALFSLAIILGMIGHQSSDADDESAEWAAYSKAEQMTRQRMKDPASAVFDGATYFRRQDGMIEVGGLVRGKNSFGAVVPEAWRMVIDGEKPVYYRIGKQTIYGAYPEIRSE